MTSTPPKPPLGASPRRWSHRLRHSLRWRLVALFLVLALALSAAFVGGMQKSFAVGWRDAVRPLLSDYVDRLAAEIGSPPDTARAQALVARLPVSVRIEGPAIQFDSHPNKPSNSQEPWRHREFNERTHDNSGYGQDRANARLLVRTTADGHTIRFGLGDLNWRRGPGGFIWITLAVLLALTALAFAYVRRLLKPLDDIGAGAQRFGAGDFTQPIKVRRHDELGDLAQQINTMGQGIHQMLEGKRALLLAISHELRSPLTRARLNTELLPENADTLAPRHALLRDLALMGGLITDLLESERLSGNHAPLNLAWTPLGDLVQEVVSDMEGSAVTFAITVGPELPQIQIDPVRITLLLRNLLDNAVRHGLSFSQASNQAGSAVVAVSLSLEKIANNGPAFLQLTVRDHGPGVPESQLPHLTEPFFRADAGRQRSTGGVGLGLYLCRLVAQAHRGSLQVRNAAPGLEVTVRLPLGSA